MRIFLSMKAALRFALPVSAALILSACSQTMGAGHGAVTDPYRATASHAQDSHGAQKRGACCDGAGMKDKAAMQDKMDGAMKKEMSCPCCAAMMKKMEMKKKMETMDGAKKSGACCD